MTETRQHSNDPNDPSSDPRVLLFSQRRLEHLLTRCVSYEFEDVIREIDDVDMVAPEPTSCYRFASKVALRTA
ncbi:MAG: hypothetical protein ACQCXQ_09665 [Verrucomicrobiales bacterium]|nr:hypothetical protein [Verrucomicrobiota bacterium JB025]